MAEKSIVILENDQSILELIEYILVEEGFKAVGMLNENGLWNLKEMPDLILLDNWLDGRKGEEICIELKQNRKTANIPVVLMSANNNLAEIASNCKADAFINKPFDINDFVKQVKMLIH